MKVYGKKSLSLKEMTYKKKNVILKEDDTVYTNDVSGMAKSLNKDGDVTITNQTPRKTIDVNILTKNNNVTPQDIQSSDELQSALTVAKNQPVDVEVNAQKVNGTVTPIGNRTQSTALAEGFKFTKREMSSYLNKL